MTQEIANSWTQDNSREFNKTAFPWQVGGGGTEIPMRTGATREWAIYCFNYVTKKHGYYLFDKDVFVDEYYFSVKEMCS